MSNVQDLLARTANKGKKEKEKKSKVPTIYIKDVIGVDNKKLIKAVNAWRTASKAAKDAESQKAEAEEILIPFALEEKLRVSRAEGEFNSSISIDDKMVVTQTIRYSKVSSDSEDALKAKYGKDFERYFSKKTNIELTTKAIADEGFMKKLIRAMGGEKQFAKYCTVEIFFEVTEQLHHERELKEDVEAKTTALITEDVIHPYKPTCKLA